MWAKSGSYDTKVDGKKVWGNTPDATNTFQLPVGVAVRGDIMTASGWNVRPQADLTLIPQFGDTEQKTKLSNFNGVSDKLSGEFAGKFGTNINLGVQADKGPASATDSRAAPKEKQTMPSSSRPDTASKENPLRGAPGCPAKNSKH